MRYSPQYASLAILLILLLPNVSPAQQTPVSPSPQSKAAVLPDTGSVSDHIYTNDFFGFSCPFPAGWRAQSKKEQRQVAEEGHKSLRGNDPEESAEHQEAMKWMWTLFGAVKDLKAGPLGPSVQIVAFDLKGDPTFKGPAEFLSGISEEMKRMGGEIVQKPTESLIAGRKFFSIKMKIGHQAQDPGSAVVHWAAALTVEHGYALVWFFFADSQASLSELLDTLKQLQFKNAVSQGFAEERRVEG